MINNFIYVYSYNKLYMKLFLLYINIYNKKWKFVQFV